MAMTQLAHCLIKLEFTGILIKKKQGSDKEPLLLTSSIGLEGKEL
jgi:hypothetical protein